jgi:hypothetical protein
VAGALFDDAGSHLAYRGGDPTADIEYLDPGPGRINAAPSGIDYVLHIHEITGLEAVFENIYRLATPRQIAEDGQYSGVWIL